jgi:feruloyl esterase
MKARACRAAIRAAAAVVAVLFAADAAAADAVALAKSFDDVRAVSDGVCRITSVSLRLKGDPEGKDPLEMWRAEAKENVTVTDAFVRVDFTLVPEKGSDIKCRAALPLPEKWNGRLWGEGNSGRAGSIPKAVDSYIAGNSAAVTTDLGTTAAGPKFLDKSIPWPDGVLRDFHWRATHLMTVYGKKIVKAFYGRPCDHAYFRGGSTGGRQGMSEALRFPEDYDGIVSVLPDNNAAVSDLALWHLWGQTHDADGNALFSKEDLVAVADAAVEYMSKTDPKPYAGHVVADGRFSEKDIDGFLALAAERRPAIAEGDRIQRLKALYMPLVHNGRCYFTGFAPGTNHAVNYHWGSLLSIPHFLAGKGYKQDRWKDVCFDQINMYMREHSPEFNACSTDLSAFVKRGGKIIMTTGWEDQTIPPGPIIDYYERVCEAHGGIGEVSKFMRLFCIPGCAHGGGKGRLLTGSPSGGQLNKLLVDWCENGKAPEKIFVKWRDGSVTMPVAPYPGLYYQDDAGKWKVRQQPRGVPRIDALCLETKTTGLESPAEGK